MWNREIGVWNREIDVWNRGTGVWNRGILDFMVFFPFRFRLGEGARRDGRCQVADCVLVRDLGVESNEFGFHGLFSVEVLLG